MTNTFWAMVIPFLVSPWNMLIMRNFFMARELEAAAIIQGHAAADPGQDSCPRCSPRRSPPSAATPCHWNDAFLYINDTVKLPLQVVLAQHPHRQGMLAGSRSTPGGKEPAMIVVTAVRLPLHPALSRAMIGSIKG